MILSNGVLWTLRCTAGHYRNMKRTVVWLTDPQVKQLSRISEKSLAPVSALVRLAVEEFLVKNRKYKVSKSGR